MKITIKDVAKEAKVSISTVSRVLSDSNKISKETKEIVFKAIKKLDYKPNAIARSLANKKRNMLGVVLPNEAQDLINSHFFVEAMKGMSLYAQSVNYYITYVFSKNEEDEERHIRELCNSSLVDGICLLRASENDKTIEFLKNKNFPFVIIGRPELSEGMLWVDNDNFKASYNLNEKLIKKGIKNIAFFACRPKWNMTKDRLNGYKVAHEVNGIKINEKLISFGKEFTEKVGYDLTEELINKKIDFEAIFTIDDLLAIGALKKLKENNMENISVTGFNNIPLAPYQDPPLASIDIHARELGYMAVKLLINKLEDKLELNNHYIIQCEFLERSSFR